jgi:Fe-Mn family superoxide dismutase
MELHHKKHHQTYVNSFNDASEKLAAAQEKSDIAAQIALQPLINFHGGGHLNHTLFWENLAPKRSGGGEPPSAGLKDAISQTYGSLENMKSKFNAALAGIQGSGWAWLVCDKETGQISIRTYAVRLCASRMPTLRWLIPHPESGSGGGEICSSSRC